MKILFGRNVAIASQIIAKANKPLCVNRVKNNRTKLFSISYTFSLLCDPYAVAWNSWPSKIVSEVVGHFCALWFFITEGAEFMEQWMVIVTITRQFLIVSSTF